MTMNISVFFMWHSITGYSEGSKSRQTLKLGMDPVRLGTKNHCAGEGQLQFSSQTSICVCVCVCVCVSV
jgi:hypothetical protein